MHCRSHAGFPPPELVDVVADDVLEVGSVQRPSAS
jgi:hypothetical protein